MLDYDSEKEHVVLLKNIEEIRSFIKHKILFLKTGLDSLKTKSNNISKFTDYFLIINCFYEEVKHNSFIAK